MNRAAAGGHRWLGDLPRALDDPWLIERLTAARPAVFLDYDGTLTPIVDTPEEAVMDESMRAVVRSLGERCPVCIVTGRDLAVIRGLLGLDEVIIAANHGFDIWSPAAGVLHRQLSDGERQLMREVETTLRSGLAGIPGVMVEPKSSSVAAHVRSVPPERRGEVASIVQNVVAAHPGRLRVTPGKMVHDLQPNVEWDKGRAVLHVLGVLGLDGPEVAPLYLGDDVTDENAFAVVRGRGEGIIVGRPDDPEMRDRATQAAHRLDTVGDVREFLGRLAAALPIS